MGQKHKVNALIMWSSTCLIAGILQVVVGDYVVQVAHQPVHHVQHVPAEREVHVSGHVGPAVVVMEPSFYDHHLAPAYSAPTVHHHFIAPVVQHGGPHAVAPVAQHRGPHAVAPVAQHGGPHAVAPVVQHSGPYAVAPVAQHSGYHAVAPVAQHSGPHAPALLAHPEPVVNVQDNVPHMVAPVVQPSGPHAAPAVAHPEPMVVVPDHVPAYAGDSEEFNMPAVQHVPAVQHGGVEMEPVNQGREGFAAVSAPPEYHGMNVGHHGFPNHYSAPVVHKSSTPVKKTSVVRKSSKPAHSGNNKHFDEDVYNFYRQRSQHGTTDNFDRRALQRRLEDDYSNKDSDKGFSGKNSFNHRMSEDYHGMENHFDRSSNKHENLEDGYNKKDSNRWFSGKHSFNHRMNEDYHRNDFHFDRSSNKKVSYENLEDGYYSKKDFDKWNSGKDSFNHRMNEDYQRNDVHLVSGKESLNNLNKDHPRTENHFEDFLAFKHRPSEEQYRAENYDGKSSKTRKSPETPDLYKFFK